MSTKDKEIAWAKRVGWRWNFINIPSIAGQATGRKLKNTTRGSEDLQNNRKEKSNGKAVRNWRHWRGLLNETRKGGGVTTLEGLLKKCCEKKGRKEITDKSGIGEKLVLSWVNRADLSRINGVSTQYADLLECAGVDTVPELAQRKPENLQSKMYEINADKKLVRKVPSVSQVQDWVAQATNLPRAVTH